MQKLRPYILPGLFVFHLMTVCVMLATVSRENEISGRTNILAIFSLANEHGRTVIVIAVSQFFLTALFAGLGPGSWVLRIPCWGALGALSWLSFVFFVTHSSGHAPPKNAVWDGALAPLIIWIVLVSLLLCLRGIPLLKWRIALQPSQPDSQSVRQPRHDSLTRGILTAVATWAGVLMLLKDSWPWSILATEFGKRSDDLLSLSGIAALVGAGALALTVLTVGLTLTRLADWMFYRRRWILPLLAILLTGTAIMLLLSFGAPFKNGSERLLAVLWLLAGMATQPLTALLVMGLAGYRLAPRKHREIQAGQPSSPTATTFIEKSVENWFLSLQRPHVAALIGVLVFLFALIPTGILNQHRLTMNSASLINGANTAGLKLVSGATNNSLRAISDLEHLQSLDLSGTRITGAGLVHLQGLTKLKSLRLERTPVTDAGLVHIKGLTSLQELLLTGCQNITGAGLAHLRDMPSLTSLGLNGTEITDAGLVHLKGLTNLKSLRLEHTHVTDAGIAELAGMNLKSLDIPNEARTDIGLKHYLAAVDPPRSLDLQRRADYLGNSGWKITDAGLVHLNGLAQLETLSLDNTAITGPGLVHLKGLTDLKLLGLRRSQVTDAGLVHLKGLTKLKQLDLWQTQITDNGLVHIKGLTSLQELLLTGCQNVTDAGLVHLKGLTNLQNFSLWAAPVTDAGLVHLQGMTNLKILDLRDTKVTDAGVAELKQALPNCEIKR